MKYKEYAKIIDRKVSGPYLSFKLSAERIAKESKPGQFINIRADESFDPLLRRPISISGAEGDILSILVMAKGKGSKKIAEKQVGDTLNIIGPLGNGFPIPDRAKKVIFIAGGIGIAPFLYFAKRVNLPTLLLGVRSQNFFPDLSEMEKHCEIKIASDDGSAGIKGDVIDLLKNKNLENCAIYVCGPEPMFVALTKYFQDIENSRKMKVEAYYSLETYMACGFGACMGCSVRTTDDDLKLSCIDGPVFPWNEVLW